MIKLNTDIPIFASLGKIFPIKKDLICFNVKNKVINQASHLFNIDKDMLYYRDIIINTRRAHE